MLKFIFKLIVTIMLLASPMAHAGYGEGTVKSVSVGRLGYQVTFAINGAVVTYPSYAAPCVSPSAGRYHYSFSLKDPTVAGKEMLSTLLMAYASGKSIYVVGNDTCNVEPSTEDVNYIVTEIVK